jgi:ATP-dependent Clp protease ATP-binding subunit ClpB
MSATAVTVSTGLAFLDAVRNGPANVQLSMNTAATQSRRARVVAAAEDDADRIINSQISDGEFTPAVEQRAKRAAPVADKPRPAAPRIALLEHMRTMAGGPSVASELKAAVPVGVAADPGDPSRPGALTESCVILSEKEQRIKNLEIFLQSRVIGQVPSINRLVEAVKPGELGLSSKNMPKSLTLVSGPTGTGKTKAILEMSRYLYGPKARVARIDVGNFSTEESIGNLIGRTGLGQNPKGVFGDEIAKLRSSGGGMILLDEIEKGHAKVADILLGVEVARLQLADGEVVDLSDYHIFATSNLAAKEMIAAGDANERTLRRVLEQAATAFFRPEVFARFNAVVVYGKLRYQDQLKICQQMLDEELVAQEAILREKLGVPGFKILTGEGVFRRLVHEGYHRDLGARPMRTAVMRRVQNAISEALLRGHITPGMCEGVLELAGEKEGLRLVMSRRSALSVPV